MVCSHTKRAWFIIIMILLPIVWFLFGFFKFLDAIFGRLTDIGAEMMSKHPSMITFTFLVHFSHSIHVSLTKPASL